MWAWFLAQSLFVKFVIVKAGLLAVAAFCYEFHQEGERLKGRRRDR